MFMGPFGQNTKGTRFCILAHFEYSLKKIDFSANRCLFMLVVVSIQTRVNSASNHTNWSKIRYVFPIFRGFGINANYNKFRV